MNQSDVKIAVKSLEGQAPVYRELVVSRKYSPGSGHPLKSDEEIVLEHGCFIIRETPLPSISSSQKYGPIGRVEDGIYLTKERPVLELTAEEITQRGIMMQNQIITAIKEEAQRRILKVAPVYKQLNMQERALWLLRAGEPNWTDEQKIEAASDEKVFLLIGAIRARSNELETTLPDDYTDDKHWPE
jgi:hypothetical protein